MTRCWVFLANAVSSWLSADDGRRAAPRRGAHDTRLPRPLEGPLDLVLEVSVRGAGATARGRRQRQRALPAAVEDRHGSLHAVAVIATPLPRCLALATLLVFAPFYRAAATPQPVSVPLTIPETYLTAQARDVMGLSAEGRGELAGDACNRLGLSALSLTGSGETLALRVDVDAQMGLDLFGACRGSAGWQGQLLARLRPRLDETGSAILFAVEEAELRQADGGDSVLTTPSRVLSDRLILPRLETLTVDVSETLGEVDAIVAQFLGPAGEGLPTLAEQTRLTAVSADPRGLAVTLALAVNERERNAAGRGEAALTAAELAEWARIEDAIDGFLTLIVTDLAERTDDRGLQLDMLALLIDVRMRIAEALQAAAAGEGGGEEDEDMEDPTRALFLDSWRALSDLALRLPPDSRDAGAGLRLASFLAAGDALALVDAVGPQYGIEISGDGLRRLARMLLAGEAPAALTPLPLAPDPRLQRLFGFGDGEGDSGGDGDAPAAARGGMGALSWLRRLSPVAPAWAAADSAELLRRWVPLPGKLDSYLGTVATLIEDTLQRELEESRLDGRQRELFEPLVRATAWKETCWRHYVLRNEELVVIRSAVGAVGMMQIVGRVWRSVYDLERLESDVTYNLAAGIGILEHYFLDYAVRRGEHRQPGGNSNLVRATYAAYNGGPSRLTRYRNASAPARARAVDEQFYATYQAMQRAPWPETSRCYGG
jgi:soluble lytic murein transglycosylase-like protein